jgi:hypothetical protein
MVAECSIAGLVVSTAAIASTPFRDELFESS